MLIIRPATTADVPTILAFIRELALFEREPDAVLATEADLLRDGFGISPDGVVPLHPAPTPRFTCLIADWAEPENTTPAGPVSVGFALYFTSYSTWLGHHGIRLEDLYVTPGHRKKGIGKALLSRLAQIAVAEGCGRLEWDVLDWNANAIAVYERLGATVQAEWRIMRLAGGALHALANNSMAHPEPEVHGVT
jgi:GNAT superfamily N-acetyltransferase